jgi:transcriptional regulator with XRE-family HTH domain
LEIEVDSAMKIDGSRVREMRERKAWSQEHLASVSGLSVRTIQRVEADGTALPETRLALASALMVSAAELMAEEPARGADQARAKRGARLGWIGWAVGFGGALAGILTSHFNGASAEDTSHALGVVCGMAGLSAAVIGMLGERARRGQTTD